MNKCLYCGKETTNRKYCSRPCMNKGRTKIKPINCCLRCGKETNNKYYCSLSCISKGKISPHKGIERVKRYKIYCLTCGKEIRTTNKNGKYCCVTCVYLAYRERILSAEIKNKIRNKLLGRKLTPEHKLNIKLNCKGWAHMKGRPSKYKGKSMPQVSGEKNGAFGKVFYPKPIFDNILGHITRSSWEKEIGLNFKNYNINYQYEPEAFKLTIDGKMCTYTPDFKINDVYVEVKGPIYDWQIRKMQEFRKEHTLKIICNDSYVKKLTNLGFDCYSYDKIIGGELDIKEVINDNI